MAKTTTIHVTGDAYRALFYLPRGCIFLDGTNGHHAYAHSLPVGTEYIFRAIRAVCAPQNIVSKNVNTSADVKVSRNHWYGKPGRGKPPMALYEIGNAGRMPTQDDATVELPVLRVSGTETQELDVRAISSDGAPLCGSNRPMPEEPDVLVHWIGKLAKQNNRPRFNARGPRCGVHIQIGLAGSLGASGSANGEFNPANLATPTHARIVVVNVGEVGATHRIRRSLSYEAIAVDLLRYLRGSNAGPTPCTELLKRLSMDGQRAAPVSMLAVRLNNSAVFLYACKQKSNGTNTESNGKNDGSFDEIGAWLFCHKNECAPLSHTDVGPMVGYTGFVSAHLAASMAQYIRTAPQPADDRASKHLLEAAFAGVRRSLAWQRVSFERGCLHMLFQETNRSSSIWTPISGKITGPRTGYENMFEDIVRSLNAHCRGAKINARGSLEKRLAQFDKVFDDEIHTVHVQITRAVAHRTQWFMARSVAAEVNQPTEVSEEPSINDDDLKGKFHDIAMRWLSTSSSNPQVRKPKMLSVPIVRIGDAELTDRREVEDFLAIHHALNVYAHSKEAKPLNIAVFGSPGAGKSFAVNQVVKHIGETSKGFFKQEPLTFNVSQFKSLDDLPAALHLVRNECLSPEIPIVFFDEFDSSFHGQPFGWLKFFLAPMQDGKFYHAGQNYKMGRAVFVFAGGVNRSFEELNGRVRNPSFCEAKGSDFISRLKAHLNVQGINKPEGEADQSRYILRRGILLRGIVGEKLGLTRGQKHDELLHPSVANALLKVEHFKHGVRSLEAIIKMCSTRPGHPIGPSDLPSMDQLEMHVDATKLLRFVDGNE